MVSPSPSSELLLNSASPLGPALIFAQHGWADNGRALQALVQSVASPDDRIIAPSLNYWQTWLRIEPLIQAAEAIAQQQGEQYPDLPWRIVGHSMGGLIWLELLNRHPDWWPRVESLVLIGSPVGGSDICRVLDPMGVGLGIARDLGRDRRDLARAIAERIPTLSIATDIGNGSDGTVPLTATQFAAAQSICLPKISHPAQRCHPAIAHKVQCFWQEAGSIPTSPTSPGAVPPLERLLAFLLDLPHLIDTHHGEFGRSRPLATFADGASLRLWVNPLGVLHVYLGDRSGRCRYAGFAGWPHRKAIEAALQGVACLKDEWSCAS